MAAGKAEIIDLDPEEVPALTKTFPITEVSTRDDASTSGSSDRTDGSGVEDEAKAEEDNVGADGENVDEAGSQWSVYEDMLDAAEEGVGESIFEQPISPADACTPEEKEAYRKLLRRLGEELFLRNTVDAGIVTRKKLCTAFVPYLPIWLNDADDEDFEQLLTACIRRELIRRIKLPQYNTIDDAVDLIKKSSRIIVLTGAGISTSLGIPDFRSKETGLYSQLAHLGLSDPQEVFDIHLFSEDPSIFYSIAKDILPSGSKYSPTHGFIRLLQDQGKLLTNFTQNIDNLEQCAGISRDRLIQCHGSFATATCRECKYKVNGEEIKVDIKAGRIPQCKRCIDNLRHLIPGLKRKRSSEGSIKPRKKRQDWEDSSDEDEDNEVPVAGIMKPDITFFGEDLPEDFYTRLIKHDREIVDLVIVIGTSLKVAPVSEVTRIIPSHVPQIYISREACNHVEFDISLLGDCDTVVTELARRVGWDFQHEMICNEPISVDLMEGHVSRYQFKQDVA